MITGVFIEWLRTSAAVTAKVDPKDIRVDWTPENFSNDRPAIVVTRVTEEPITGTSLNEGMVQLMVYGGSGMRADCDEIEHAIVQAANGLTGWVGESGVISLADVVRMADMSDPDLGDCPTALIEVMVTASL